MRPFCLSFLLLAVVISGCAPDSKSVRVISEDGNPVHGAHILPKVRLGGGNDHITNRDGWATVYDSRGKYRYRVYAPGFQDAWIDYPDEDGMEVVLQREAIPGDEDLDSRIERVTRESMPQDDE